MGGEVMKPYCFVLTPFGRKTTKDGRAIDFDCIYREIISPGIATADMEPIRADQEVVGGTIHKPMFERLMLCDYAVADLTTANPNTLYELGIRHGIRPHSTVLIFATGTPSPFDVVPLRGLPYVLGDQGLPIAATLDADALSKRLIECRTPAEDRPLFQLVAEWPRPDIARLKTDRFRDLVEYSRKYKDALAAARRSGSDAVAQVEKEINVLDADPALVVDLCLSYRAVKEWQRMIDLVPKMSPVLARTVMIQEQLAFALNRVGRPDEAERVLKQVISEHGHSSETDGILGRVYKDRWENAEKSGDALAARGFLRKAIDAYVCGFEADWRDAYPGVNAVTLMEMCDPADPRQPELLPVVKYAVRRRLSAGKADYWDYATMLELDVLANDIAAARQSLEDAAAHVREVWEPQTTARNLTLIAAKRRSRGVEAKWIEDIIAALVS
jgi:tetratricopeptide (TPR) repeat protein